MYTHPSVILENLIYCCTYLRKICVGSITLKKNNENYYNGNTNTSCLTISAHVLTFPGLSSRMNPVVLDLL